MDAYSLLRQYLRPARAGGQQPYYTLPYSRYADDPLSFSKRGWEDATIPASPKIDPFIYKGRDPTRTNENLTDEEIANAIKTRDIAISPSRPNFGPAMPRFETDDDLRRAGYLNSQVNNRLGYTGNDISLSGTPWELTPQQMLELRAQDEARAAAARAAPQYGPLGNRLRPEGEVSNDPLTVLLRYLGGR